MGKQILPIFLTVLLITTQTYSQTIESLRQNIEQIINSKNAIVGVAINGVNDKDMLSINGTKHFPMQSVFKFPIALTMLAEIDKGHFSFDQKIDIKKNELLPGLWSPIREKYPEGTTLTVAEILKYTITLSDNVGCDILLKQLGKPQTVETYFSKNNFKDIAIKINEETMQNNWDLQFQNWTTPKEANRILQVFYENKENLLSQRSYDFVWKMMKATQTGKNRLKGQLPEETIVAHKTGWSGQNESTGITAAVNDIGIIFLPDGKYFFISVFVTQSMEDLETNEEIISDIAKAAWDYFSKKQ
ncbi:class A beta-lactamase, subclass A2 [Maribellus maritimus]|uniref:class A beta-lactamase, subclass A2 n=1 Tax=Maribellus maritimus TaxID=2870838 RepID=UPI001EEAD42E|nr:class A beta-lactamase, subclass A2 [Maribellus maritimus]MCG6191187.1 class A beta-lactamase, subclass A2 [Maribellus maritimus]